MALTAEELRRYADEHLYYEIWMTSTLTERMRRHAVLFDSGLSVGEGRLAREVLDLAGRNADIESFAMHVRNLNFFLYPTKPKQSDVIAADYFDRVDNWNRIRPTRPKSLARVNARVPIEIVHPSSGRLVVREDDKKWRYDEMWRDLATVIRTFIDNVPEGRVTRQFGRAVASLLRGSSIEEAKDFLTEMRRETLAASVGATTTDLPSWRSFEDDALGYGGGTAVLPPKRELSASD